MLKGGVIGFGGVGQGLTKYINTKCDRARIVAACNRGKDKLEKAKNEYGLRVTHDVEELCGWDLDFVLVVSTNHAHKEQVLAAARQGLHIFCEKPIANNVADGLEMVAAVKKAGVQTVVNYSLRYCELVDTLLRFRNEGWLGEALSISFEKSRAYGFHATGARHRAIEEPEESGGWIIHHMCHQLDLLYYLFGEYSEVYCNSRTTLPEKNSEELIFAGGVMKNGVMFHLCDTIARIPYENIVIHGTKASFALQSDGNYNMIRLHEEKIPAANYMNFSDGWITSREKPHRSFEHFIDCIEGKAEPAATLESSIESLLVAQIMKDHMNTGKALRVDDFR